MVRWHDSATVLSCVTTRMVAPSRAVQVPDERQDLGARVGVEVAVGSSASRNRRAGRQRAGDSHPLALAARQLVGKMIEPGAELDQPEQLPGAIAGLAPRPAAQVERQGDVLEARQRRSKLKNWKMNPTFSRLTRVSSSSESPESARPPIRTSPEVGPVEAADEVEQRRLARPRRPDDRDHLAGPDGEINTVKRRHLALSVESLRDVREFNHAARGRRI